MNRKPRLAVVVSHAIPYYAPLYRALVKHGGIDVRVFFASRIGLNATHDPGMGLDIVWKTDLLAGYEHEFLPGADAITATSFNSIDNPRVGEALAAFAPDVILIHGYVQKTPLKALAWARRRGVPAMMISDSSLHAGTSASMQLAKRMVLLLILRQFSAMLSIGDANQKYLETYGVPRSRIFRVPNMVDEGFWAFREKRAAVRQRVRAELGLVDNDLAVLFVGKLIPRKRPGDIVEALLELARRQPGARTVKALFAGDGVQRAELEQRAAAAGVPARFLGFVNIDTLPGYYCAADVLAHPAEIEAFGVIVLEAAILGLPLVLSERVGALGPTSIARAGENVFVHPCADIPALADALQRLAREPVTLARMAAASLRISEELDWRMVVAGTQAAIDYCLAGGRKPRTPQSVGVGTE